MFPPTFLWAGMSMVMFVSWCGLTPKNKMADTCPLRDELLFEL